MKYADTHAHLDTFANRGELEKIVERARLAGVEKIVGCSTKSDEWLLYERAAADFPGEVYWQIGIHPGEISENCEIALDSLSQFASYGHAVETGRSERLGLRAGSAAGQKTCASEQSGEARRVFSHGSIVLGSWFGYRVIRF